MYQPTEMERKECIRIVKEILKTDDNSECKIHSNNILKTAYSIGGNYDEKTLRAIAETMLNNS